MIKTSLVAASLAIASIGAAVSTPAAAQVYVQVAPPTPRVEYVPAPRRNQVWVPGHYDWRGRQYVWVGGHWVRERPGYVYYGPTWVQYGDRWVQRPGAWRRGDRDHDGIPNRYDRDRDNDGVPNRWDNNPNNPYRR